MNIQATTAEDTTAESIATHIIICSNSAPNNVALHDDIREEQSGFQVLHSTTPRTLIWDPDYSPVSNGAVGYSDSSSTSHLNNRPYSTAIQNSGLWGSSRERNRLIDRDPPLVNTDIQDDAITGPASIQNFLNT
jgi:hypothetical protein